MEEQEKPQCHFCMGLLIGGALGALAGIFFAPKSGKELRSDISEKGIEVIKDAKEIIGEVKHQAKDLEKEAEGTCEKIAGKVQEKIGQVQKVFEK